MQNNQKINCTVESCKYNKCNEHICSLEQILVTPTNNCKTQEPNESMCESYEYNSNNG